MGTACYISTNNHGISAKHHFLNVLREVNVCLQALCVCFCVHMHTGTKGMFNMGKPPLNYPGMAWECLHRLGLNWKLVGARVSSKHWGLSACLQKEIAEAPLLGLAKSQLEKAAGDNIWYGRNNIVAARGWIRWVKRFFHFLTSVICCARDDLNFFSLMSAHFMSNMMGPPEKYWQCISSHTMSLHQPWKGYLC